MKPGTPGFIPDRLRVAREARGISAASLAELINVSRAAISQYEKGQQSPSPDVMQKICDKLSLPLHHFLRPLNLKEEGVIFYRSLSSATKSARIKAQQRYLWFKEITEYLQKYIKFPPVDIPDFDIANSSLQDICDEDIENIASQTRLYWKINNAQIANVITLFEKKGIILARHELDSEKLDAFSEWCENDKRPYMILNSEKNSAVRSRFDASHELAHLILHKHVSRSMLNSPVMFSHIEQQANRFSAAFLLPEKEFCADLHSLTLDSFRTLKQKWRVSIGVMIKRVAQLGLISEDNERQLWINYSRRGWRKREPLDDQLDAEQPRFIRRCIELLIEKQVLLKEDFPVQLALQSSDIENLVGLTYGYFRDNDPEIIIDESEIVKTIPFPVHKRS